MLAPQCYVNVGIGPGVVKCKEHKGRGGGISRLQIILMGYYPIYLGYSGRAVAEKLIFITVHRNMPGWPVA